MSSLSKDSEHLMFILDKIEIFYALLNRYALPVPPRKAYFIDNLQMLPLILATCSKKFKYRSNYNYIYLRFDLNTAYGFDPCSKFTSFYIIDNKY